jgi:hypothetical protein
VTASDRPPDEAAAPHGAQAAQRVRQGTAPAPSQPGLGCPGCGAPNEIDAACCEECGAALRPEAAPRCHACREPHAADAAYCETCGEALGVERASVDAAPEAVAPPLLEEGGCRKADSTADQGLLDGLVVALTAPEPAPLRPLADAAHLARSREQAETRFASRAEEVRAIQELFEREHRRLDALAHGLEQTPRVLLWLCNHSNSYHTAPAQCARPERGGALVTVSEDEFKSMKWMPENP